MPSYLADIAANWTIAHSLSTAALGVSLLSLTVSIRNYRRDNPRLKITARRVRRRDGGLGYIEVKAVNVGRRPLYLTMLCGSDDGKQWSSEYLDSGGPGLKVGEHEFMTFRIVAFPNGEGVYDAWAMLDDVYIEFTRMQIEDSTGQKHEIPRLRKLLVDLRAEYNDWCEEERRRLAASVTPPLQTPPAGARPT
ncbi:hypothetical protein [Roseateles chitosanitabidus]|uniref:hypothetical protein n=1 Tax=Roseateles chitosanitabidus TaxID=65048 RepID=UPI0008295AB8|nr:hypothetical protein [Roseateles chitosanitabidus]